MRHYRRTGTSGYVHPRATSIFSERFYVLLVAFLPFFAAAQTSYTWNGSASSAWNSAANWTPNTGFPLAADHATIVAAGASPVLDMSRSVTNLTLTSGTLDLNGFTLTSTGTGAFNGGAMNNGTLAPNTTSSMTFAGTVFGAAITGTSGVFVINSGTFNGPVTATKTTASNDYWQGNATFNNTVTLTATAGRIYPAYTGTSLFNGNLLLNSTGGSGGVWIGQGGGTATLANGRTITAGSAGFTVGSLAIRNFTQLGTTAQNLVLAPGATIYYQVGTTFNGNLTSTSGALYFTAATFNGTVRFTKTANTNEYGGGNNVFNGDVEFIVNAGGIFPAYSGADQYNGNLVLNCTGSTGIQFGGVGGTSTLAAGRTVTIGSAGFSSGILEFRGFTTLGTTPQVITLSGTARLTCAPGTSFGGDLTATASEVYLTGTSFGGNTRFTKTGNTNDHGAGGCVFAGDVDLVNTGPGLFGLHNVGNDIFNGNVRLHNTSTGSIRFGSTSGTSTLAAGRTISVGSGGYANGLLMLRGLTQLGSTAQTITVGPSVITYWGSGCTFGGDLTATGGGHIITGNTFHGTTRFIKQGTSNESSGGGNTFNGPVEFTNNSAGAIQMTDAGADQFNGNITLNCAINGSIRFGNGGGLCTLAAGRTISAGSGGYNGALLLLRNFTQVGTTPQVINLSAATTMYFYPNCTFNGNVTTVSGGIFPYGSIFNGDCHFTKTGAFNDAATGGCTFNGRLEIVNTNTGLLFMGDTQVNNLNGDVLVSNLSTGQIRFGNAAGGGAVLANGRTITVGSGGFNSGLLLLRDFVQVGGTPQNIALGGGAALYIYPNSVFNADLTTTSGFLCLMQGTYHGLTNFTKTGNGNDVSPGGNIFNQRLEFTNTSTAVSYMAETMGDTYNSDLVVNNTSTGQIRFGSGAAVNSTLAPGKTVSVGSGGFNTGALMLRRFVQQGPTPQTITLGTGATLYLYQGTTFDGDLVTTSGSLYLGGATFNGTGRFTKTGPSGDGSLGGCVFNGFTEFTNTNVGNLSLDYTGADAFNADLVLNNTSTGQINFGQAGGSATLAAGRTITVGSGGFNAGQLVLRNFTQVGGTPQTLLLGSAAYLYYYGGTTFNGNVVSNSGGLYFGSCTFNGTGKFTKTGPSGDGSLGNCVFNGFTEFINTNTGNLSLDYTGADAFNADVVINNTSTGQINFGQNGGSATLAAGRTISVGSLGFNSGLLTFRNFTQLGTTPQNLPLGTAAGLYYYPGTVFNGNIVSTSGTLYFWGTTFNGTGKFSKTGPSGDGSQGGNIFNGFTEFINSNTGNLSLDYTGVDAFNGDVVLNNSSSGQINFGQNGGSATLAAGRTISLGSLGFNAGFLFFRNFTQVGGTPQSLPLGTSASLTFQTGNTFNGNITTTSGALLLNGTTFNGAARFTKTGPSGDGCVGGNIYNGPTEFIVTSTGHLSIDQSAPDQFNNDVLLNCTNAGIISTGQGVGTATLAAGRTIGVGSLGFTAGTLQLKNFTQIGATPQTLTLGNNATMSFQANNVFDGNMTASAGSMMIAGSVFNGTGWFRKTNASSSVSAGGNTFNGAVELVNIGAGTLYMNNTVADVYNSSLLLNSTGALGINFGNSTGTATLNGPLGIGSVGFTAGTLVFRNFTKVNTTASTLTGSVNTAITFAANSTFNGDITSTVGHLLFNGTTFNGNGVFTKTGTTNNASAGGNVFNGDVEINAGGTMTLAGSAADDFNGNVTFRRTAAGTFTVNNTFNTSFSKNVSTVGSTGGPVQFGAGAGRTIFDGTTVQTFDCDAANPPNVRNLTLAMSGAGELQLLGNVSVQVDMAFTSGVVKPMAATSTSNGLLIINPGVTFSDAADNASYVDGFMRKIGNTAFSFPVGNMGVLAPVSMTAPAVATHHFTAKYVHDDSHATYTHTMHDITIDHLSRCEYWILDRTNSTTNVTVTLAFDSIHSCGVTNLSDLVVARWNGTTWKDHGNGGTTGTTAGGTIKTLGPVTAFSPFTLASRSSMNPLPIELVEFNATDEDDVVLTSWITATEVDNDFFEVERSADGITFERITVVDGAGYSQTLLTYGYSDEMPLPGTSFYRLKQVDFNGAATYSTIVPVTRSANADVLRIWPNPVVGAMDFALSGDQRMNAVRIHDASGRLVMDRRFIAAQGAAHIDLNDVPAGILFLSVFLEDGTIQQQRFLKD